MKRKKLERELAEARKQLALGGGAAKGADGITEAGGVKLMARVIEGHRPQGH
jgi:alanyl-tRNA synthetase